MSPYKMKLTRAIWLEIEYRLISMAVSVVILRLMTGNWQSASSMVGILAVAGIVLHFGWLKIRV